MAWSASPGLITTEVVPFRDVKDGGTAREGSVHGIEGYLNPKYLRLGGLKWNTSRIHFVAGASLKASEISQIDR